MARTSFKILITLEKQQALAPSMNIKHFYQTAEYQLLSIEKHFL
jgi:hypothetical protein